VGRAAVDQPAHGHQPGPGRLPIEQHVGAAFVPGRFVERFVQRPDAVGLGVDRVVDWEQLPGLGEQADDQPHDYSHGRLHQGFVGFGVGERPVRQAFQPDFFGRQVRLESLTYLDERLEQVRLGAIGGGDFFQEKFHGLADVFPQDARQVSLSLAGFLDGIQQPGAAFLDRLQRLRRQELPQAAEFFGAFAIVKPAVAFPFAPGLEVQARVHQPELLAVGQHPEPLAGASQQFEHLGVFRAAPPPADLRRRVCHDEQSRRLAGFVGEDDPVRTDGVRPAADADRDRELFRDVVLLGESRSRVAQQIFENGIHESQDGGLVALVVGWVSDPSPGPIGLGLRFGGEASVGVPELAQGGE